MIEIVPYRASWPEEFTALGAALRRTMGARALAIHHIGSTSVPGLAAKDVIDLQLTVASLDEPLDDRLRAAGFLPREGVFEDHLPPGATLDPEELRKRFVVHPGRRIHLHVREAGRFNGRYSLLCRDFLRGHPLAAAAYAEVKRGLARHFPEDADVYYEIKDPVFDVLMAGAEEWALRIDWSLPPSDA